jgi:hypothetical protein
VLPRVNDRAGKKRRLFGCEIRSRLAEVRACCRLTSEDPVAPFDHVQINLENAPLGECRLESSRDHHFLELAQGVLRRREIEILRELLRDRAGAAGELPFFPIGFERRANLREVDAFVIEKRAVLSHEHGPTQRTGDSRIRDPLLTNLKFPSVFSCLAFAQLDEGGRGRIDGCERTNVGQREVDVAEIGEAKRHASNRPAKDPPHQWILSELAAYEYHPTTTILMRSPGAGCSLTAWPFMIASSVGLASPPPRAAIDCHVSPPRTV